jgi:hypothetical protein
MPYTPLQIPPGVARGATPAASKGRFFNANLVRWRGPVLEPVGGWVRLSTVPLATPGRLITTWNDTAGVGRGVVMSDGAIYILEGGALTAKQPADFVPLVNTTGGAYGNGTYGTGIYGKGARAGQVIPTRPPMWSAGTWGQIMLAMASSDGRLLFWNPTAPASLFAIIPPLGPGTVPTGRAMVVTPERHVLIAGSRGDPRMLEWCSREDYTDWNFNLTTNTAGQLPVDCNGFMSALVPVREGTLLLCDDDVWLVRYVGQPYIFGAERLVMGVDLFAPRSGISYNGRAAWMGRQSFWQYEGATAVPLPCELQDYVFSNINRTTGPSRIHGTHVATFNELWWFYPSAQATECDRYVVYNYASKWWSMGSLARNAACDAGVFDVPLMIGGDGYVYLHETGWLDGTSSRVGQVYAETGAMSLGDGDSNMHVVAAELDGGSNYNATQVTTYSRNTRMGAESTFGPYTPRSSGYTDMRFQGRDVRLRIQATRDEDWSIGAMRFEIQRGAGR